MTSATLHKVYGVIVGVVVLILAYAVWSWFGEHDSRVRAEEQQKAQQQVIQTLNQSMADRDQQFQQQIAAFDQRIASIRTGQQAATVLQPIIQVPGGAQPQQITKSELPVSVQPSVPGAPDSKLTVLTEQQMIDLARAKVECDKTGADATKCHADLTDETAKFVAMQKERDSWETAAKGGSWLRRTLRIAVPVACATGGAYLGGVRSGGKGAAFGAIAGAVPCAFVIK